MPTGTILFDLVGAIPADGTGSGNNPAIARVEVSGAAQTANTPKTTQLKWLFSDAEDRHLMWGGVLPENYSSGGTLKGKVKFASATAGTAVLKAGVAFTIDGSTDDDALTFAAANSSGTIAAPGTQGQTVAFSITLTMTNAAAERKFILFLGRDPDSLDDTVVGDLELIGPLRLEYTTT